MAEPAIRARGLVRQFDDGTGVRGVDLTVHPGQIHALVGLNGAGKTTLMRLLLGMLRPTAGEVAIAGHDLDRVDWAGVGHFVERALIYSELTGRQNLAIAARLHNVPSPSLDQRIDDILGELQLGQYRDRRAGKLSLGNRHRLGLASALLHHPSVVVLDEPTNALDPAAVIRLRETLLDRAAAGAGILVSSHHLDEVARIADRISVLDAGRVIGTLDPAGTDIERAFFSLVHRDQAAS